MVVGESDVVELEETACPACGSDVSRPVIKGRDLYCGCPGEFQVVRCSGCGHAFLNPRPTLASIGRFYPPEYAPHIGSAGAAAVDGPARRSWQKRLGGVGWIRRCFDWIVESRSQLIPHVRGTDVPRGLELGCAGGAFLENLRSRGWNVIGVEPSVAAAERARQKGLDVRVGTLESAGLPDAEFDAVFAWMVMEHVHDPAATWSEMRRLLKPGGAACFSVPNFGCWERPAAGRYWLALDPPRHLQHFTPPMLRRMLGEAGFERIEIIHQRNVFNLVGTAGLWFRVHFPKTRWGDRLVRFTDDPSALGILALSPLAWFLAGIHQGGRLTVIARKPQGERSNERTA